MADSVLPEEGASAARADEARRDMAEKRVRSFFMVARGEVVHRSDDNTTVTKVTILSDERGFGE
ncbi:hypothetical protein BGE01nite_02620 [Brevifollis gellanilyticus]|uniref:Cyclic nucleotide-binding domain-containing protein n=1 Tax=Brevifollis gellanilyticus TaxID=748831 RepID=A0A512M3S4_9BACT|nr:hypothetical protein BGE01nite_02620 [Brevifollis gellanilyticus]